MADKLQIHPSGVVNADQLFFDPGPHTYTWRGRRLPSVTEVLRVGGFMGYLADIPPTILERAQARGTRVHRALELLDSLGRGSGDIEFPGADQGYIDAYKRFLRESGFLVIKKLIETSFRSAHGGYAGTLDRVYRTPKGLDALVDFKTGAVVPAARLQTAAYARRDGSHGGECLRFGLHLRGDGTYKLHEFPHHELDRDFRVFLGALAGFNFKRLYHI